VSYPDQAGCAAANYLQIQKIEGMMTLLKLPDHSLKNSNGVTLVVVLAMKISGELTYVF
jgi:hypothetical protein